MKIRSRLLTRPRAALLVAAVSVLSVGAPFAHAATAPGAPTGVTGTDQGGGSVLVSWMAPTNNGGAPVTSYVVYATGADGTTQTQETSGTSLTLSGLSLGTYYTFTASAWNGAWSAWSAWSAWVLTGSAPPSSGLIWQEDPSLGPAANFWGLETKPGTITTSTDPQGIYGPSIRYMTGPNGGVKSRAESRGIRLPDGTVYTLDSSKDGQVFYLGWRALWNPMPVTPGSWIAFYQLHMDGPGPSTGGGPIALRTLGDGMLHFQLVSANGGWTHIWSAPLRLNTWQTFVIGFKLSANPSQGWVEFWYNGVQQTFTNGSTQYPGQTRLDSWVNIKWGVYRSGSNKGGEADAYLNHARFGTSYADVAP